MIGRRRAPGAPPPGPDKDGPIGAPPPDPALGGGVGYITC
jgi:hypothetical protein